MSEPTIDPELAALEAALARLTPAPAGISRAQVLFRAGQASARRRGWIWPCVTAALALATVTLGAALLLRPEPPVVERIVYVRVEPPAPPAPRVADKPPPPAAAASAELQDGDPQPPDADYLRLRREVVQWGPDGVPHPPAPSLTPKPLSLETLLNLPPEDLRDPSFLRLRSALQSGGAS